jgi:hypothetical protein
MDETGLLLKSYWERLHDLLSENRNLLSAKIEVLLKAEFDKPRFPGLDGHKYAAYLEASLAFVEERIETYNPLGLQYLFDSENRREAAELGFGLDWFNGKKEFEQLVDAAGRRTRPDMTDEQLQQSADELIREMGAYPDKSIIAGFEADPTHGKLADYVVARAIEDFIFAQAD